MLMLLPTVEEIVKVALGFPKGKSPREDKIMYDFLQESWDFVENCCIDMVLAFWLDAKLLANLVNKIVKMVPKRNDILEILDNWCNQIMLTTTYKIISKILAKRLKPLVPKVVNQQQTGFFQGRCITDNLLSFKLGQQDAQATL